MSPLGPIQTVRVFVVPPSGGSPASPARPRSREDHFFAERVPRFVVERGAGLARAAPLDFGGRRRSCTSWCKCSSMASAPCRMAMSVALSWLSFSSNRQVCLSRSRTGSDGSVAARIAGSSGAATAGAGDRSAVVGGTHGAGAMLRTGPVSAAARGSTCISGNAMAGLRGFGSSDETLRPVATYALGAKPATGSSVDKRVGQYPGRDSSISSAIGSLVILSITILSAISCHCPAAIGGSWQRPHR